MKSTKKLTFICIFLFLIVILLNLTGCGNREYTKSTCGAVSRIDKDGSFKVTFTLYDDKFIQEHWFYSEEADTLRIGQIICLR